MLPLRLTQNKSYLAILLILTGAFAGALAILVNASTGGNAGITWVMLAVAALVTIAGSILAFSQLLDHFFQPVVDQLAGDLQDDIEDLQTGRITETHLMVAATALFAVIFTFLVFRFHKLESNWGGFPVGIVVILAVGLVAWIILRTSWFRAYKNYTPFWVYLIPAVAILVSTLTGILNTEDRRILFPVWQTTGTAQALQYNVARPVQFFLFDTAPDFAGINLDFEIPSCDDDVCSVIYLAILVIALVLLAIVLIVGSAFIPHFWLLSGSVFLAIMALIALHDLRLRPGEKTTIRPANKEKKNRKKNIKKNRIKELIEWK